MNSCLIARAAHIYGQFFLKNWFSNPPSKSNCQTKHSYVRHWIWFWIWQGGSKSRKKRHSTVSLPGVVRGRRLRVLAHSDLVVGGDPELVGGEGGELVVQVHLAAAVDLNPEIGAVLVTQTL